MAFKPSNVRAPSSPAIYKVNTDRMFGIDTTTSDDNISLSRACGTSYFDVERNDGTEQPGICNFIRTRYGEIGKRRGSKEIEISWGVFPYNNHFIKVSDNITAIVSSNSGSGSDVFQINLFIYKNGEYINKTIIPSYDKTAKCRQIIISAKMCVIIWETSVMFVDSNSLFNGDDLTAYAVYNSKLYISNKIIENTYGMTETDWSSALSPRWEIYTPTITIANTPSGGDGHNYEPVNIFSPWVTETFCGDGTTRIYNTSLKIADDSEVYVKVIGMYPPNVPVDYGNVIQDVNTGVLSFAFNEAPPKPSVTGEANVQITYRRKDFDISDTILKCTINCTFGVGGYKDRLFVSGNPIYPNRVWYSGMDDYTYFSDVGYIEFSDNTGIVKAMSGHDTSLAVITDGNCYLVTASINTNALTADTHDAAFIVSHVFESAKPAGYPTPFVFNNEVVYMSDYGLAAITPSNVMDERYVQLRSERINNWLLTENLENVQCCVVGDFFVINNKKGRVYLLDGTMFSSTASKPFSHRQYEGYIWDIEADYIWEQAGDLHFLKDNKVYRIPFSIDAENEDYIDEHTKTAIRCYWETPNIYGTDFYAKKSFTKLAVLLRKSINNNDKTEVNTTVRVWAKRDQQPWKLVKDYDGEQSVFRYDFLNYGLFSYRPYGKKYAIDKKIKFKKTYGLKLRFENDMEGIPCYLQSFGVEYCK